MVEPKEVGINGDVIPLLGLALLGLGPPAMSLSSQPRERGNGKLYTMQLAESMSQNAKSERTETSQKEAKEQLDKRKSGQVFAIEYEAETSPGRMRGWIRRG